METLFGIEEMRGEDQAPNFAKEFATLSNKMINCPLQITAFNYLL